MRALLRIFATILFAPCLAHAGTSNDEWANRTPIAALPFTTLLSMSGSTVAPSDPTPACASTNQSSTGTVWFGYTTGAAPEILTLRVSNFEIATAVAAYSGEPGTFRLASGGCARAGGAPNNAQLAGVRLAANTAYSILVSAQSPTGGFSIDFSVAQAIRYDVTKTADTFDGVCDADCSLREALGASNVAAGAVIVPAGVYTLSIAGANEDENASGDLDVRNDVGIYGAGAGTTIVDANRIDRVIDVASIVQDANTLILGDVTLTRGDASVAPRRGGAIRDLSLSPGFVGLERVAVVDNVALQSGGGLDTNSAGTIRESRFAMNDTDGSGGGALLFNPQDRPYDVDASTFDTNGGGSAGGGIFSAGNLRITNSTLSGNTAQTGAGMRAFNGPLVMASTTIAFNVGNGLWLDSPQTYSLFNNIIAGNTSGDCIRLSGTLTSQYNHVQSTTLCTFGGAGDVTGTDPGLDPTLADNGGPTPTHLLPVSSPALDAGDPAGCTAADGLALSNDQRGAGFPRESGAGCDKGAFEQQLAAFLFADGFE